MGNVLKVQVAFEAPFWRADGLSGQVTSLDEPVGFTVDNSPPDGSFGLLVGFIEGDHARAAAAMAPEARRSLVIDYLTNCFGSAAANPTDYVELDWATEEFSRGCYGGRLNAGVWTRFGAALAEPVGRIHWAGTETAATSNGYMDGAVQSGRRAAAEVPPNSTGPASRSTSHDRRRVTCTTTSSSPATRTCNPPIASTSSGSWTAMAPRPTRWPAELG